MNREIKFKGVALNTGTWVYGYYTVDSNNRHCIWTKENCVEVYANSVFQFTGLHDKNGKEIYEGDVVQEFTGVLGKTQKDSPTEIKRGEGEWLAGSLALNSYLFIDNRASYVEVIGNIYENPELVAPTK